MLPYLTGFVNLRELDLSGPSRTGLGSNTSNPLILSDKDIIGFFSTLNAHFRFVNSISSISKIPFEHGSLTVRSTPSKSATGSCTWTTSTGR